METIVGGILLAHVIQGAVAIAVIALAVLLILVAVNRADRRRAKSRAAYKAAWDAEPAQVAHEKHMEEKRAEWRRLGLIKS